MQLCDNARAFDDAIETQLLPLGLQEISDNLWEPRYSGSLWSRCQERRQELGISQEALSELAGLHRTYVADIERGIRNLSLVNIEKIAAALNISISALFVDYGVD